MLCDRVTQKKEKFTVSPTVYNPSVFHRELKKFYGSVPQSPTASPTDYNPLVFTESWKTFTRLCHNHRRNHLRCCRRILPTKSLTNYPHPEAHACQTRVHRHKYRRIFGRIEKSGGIFKLFWCAYQLISDGITDGI